MAQTPTVSLPAPGDTVYIPTALYISHGRDDFAGGRCTVSRLKTGTSAGKPTLFIEVNERPGHLYNWGYLAARQEELAARYGNSVGHADPDYSEEFNPIDG